MPDMAIVRSDLWYQREAIRESLRLHCVRALRGLDIIGADLVEVSPPFDNGGITAWLGASVMFELLCAMQP